MQIKKGGGWVDTQWADTLNNAAISLPLSPRSLWRSVNFIPVSINSAVMTPASECGGLWSQTVSSLSISQWGSSASRQCVANLLIWSQQEWKSIMRCLYNSSSLCCYGNSDENYRFNFSSLFNLFQAFIWHEEAEFEFIPFVLGCRQFGLKDAKKQKYGGLTEDYLLVLNCLQQQRSALN